MIKTILILADHTRGAHGRSRLRELILGGVTKEVLTDSDLPILICR